jgi:hypothetical protein
VNRNNIAIAAIVAALLLIAGGAQTQSTSGSVGRYQLFSGETDAGTSGPPHRAILRIDTATGTVDEWITSSVVDSWHRTGTLSATKGTK